MTALSLPLSAAFPRPGLLVRLDSDAPAFARLGLLMGLSLAVTLPALTIDTRIFQDESVWVKPVKFQIALAVYLLTLAFYARFMPEATQRGRPWRWFAVLVNAAILGEMAWIGGAAAFGTGSHFNIGTPVMSALYSLMGLLAVILTSASLVMGVAVLRNREGTLADPMRVAVGLGLVLTFVLTVPVAGYMASTTGHHVGTPLTGATLWPMGWSREVGDLRVPHFFAAHALHFIPAGGLIAALLPDRAARLAVIAGALAFAAFVGLTFWQAVSGMPFLP